MARASSTLSARPKEISRKGMAPIHAAVPRWWAAVASRQQQTVIHAGGCVAGRNGGDQQQQAQRNHGRDGFAAFHPRTDPQQHREQSGAQPGLKKSGADQIAEMQIAVAKQRCAGENDRH